MSIACVCHDRNFLDGTAENRDSEERSSEEEVEENVVALFIKVDDKDIKHLTELFVLTNFLKRITL